MIFLGDFNFKDNENHMKFFYENYSLKNLIRQPTYYKNPSNPACIDLTLTNVPHYFQMTYVVELELSDFHLMILMIYQPKL